jgi:uncharacterized damage-inducible protein DinB
MVDEDKALLIAYLNSARDHVRAALDGVSESDLRRSILPSGWSMLGLVRHLTLDVERFWFRAAMAGEDVALCRGDEAWQVPAEMASKEVLDAYVAECAVADEVVRRTPLDALPVAWREDWGPLQVESLLDVVVHVIKETATHAGHLDVARELIDGHQHLVLT